MKCPHCGGELKIVAPPRREPGVFDFAPPVKFEHTAAGAWDDMRPRPETRKWREKPARSLNVWDFGIPALFSLGSAIVAGVPTTIGALMLETPKPFLVGLAGAWLAGSAVWVWRIRAFDRLVVAFEELTGLDLNRDGNVGQPPAPKPVEVWARRKEGKHDITERFELPVDADKMADFARFILDEGNLSRDAVTAATSLSQADYNALLVVLEERGFINRTGNQRRLNGGGRALLRQLR